MSVRLIEKAGLGAVFIAGTALTPGAVSDDAARMLVTFLGLFAASLLPTITLLVNGMTASGRSVYAIEKLDIEIQAAMDALFLMFGCAALAFASLMMLSIVPPEILTNVPYLTDFALPRFGQGVVIAAVTAIVWRAGQIPAILRRALAMRKDIAVEEARRKIADNAPSVADLRSSFATHANFGRIVPLDESQSR